MLRHRLVSLKKATVRRIACTSNTEQDRTVNLASLVLLLKATNCQRLNSASFAAPFNVCLHLPPRR